jgi:hypothetical protein
MNSRCYVPSNARWQRYGGRGIQVCDRWRNDFGAFLGDMGRKPSPRHSLDRANNDGDYTPDNCRWATPRQQNRTSQGELSRNAKLTAGDVREIRRIYAAGEMTQIPLAKRFGVSQTNISDILRRRTWTHIA